MNVRSSYSCTVRVQVCEENNAKKKTKNVDLKNFNCRKVHHIAGNKKKEAENDLRFVFIRMRGVDSVKNKGADIVKNEGADIVN